MLRERRNCSAGSRSFRSKGHGWRREGKGRRVTRTRRRTRRTTSFLWSEACEESAVVPA